MHHASTSYRWCLTAFIAALLMGVVLLSAPSAYADTQDIYAEADAAQQKLEETAAEYDRITADLAKIDQDIQRNEQLLSDLTKKIESRQAGSDDALITLYKLKQNGGDLIHLVLSARSFEDFLKIFDYLTYVEESNLKELSEMAEMKAELNATAETLEQERAQAAEEQVLAQQALAEAQEARERAQAAAIAAAEAEAKAAAEAAAAASASESVEAPEEISVELPAAAPDLSEVDWSTDKASFVESWAGRLDSYLSGSPLAGYGATFAAAAWDNGIDPRFSAAISCVESSKGANCFRDHNAWGWGSVDWDSWEEAIEAHARGLARGYGYTVTVEGAKKYCPPNWLHWYTRVTEEMAKI